MDSNLITLKENATPLEAAQEENNLLRIENEDLRANEANLLDYGKSLTKIIGELRESEKRFRLLVSGVKDYAIFMLNPDGIVETWNAGAVQIKGYSADEIIGSHF